MITVKYSALCGLPSVTDNKRAVGGKVGWNKTVSGFMGTGVEIGSCILSFV